MLRIAALALALALAGTARAAETDLEAIANDPLTGCRGTISPSMWTFICFQRSVLMVVPADGDEMAVMQLGMATLQVRSAVVVEIEARGSKPVKAFESTSGGLNPVLATVVQRRPGVFDFVGCSGDRQICERLLVGLDQHGFPDLEDHLQVWRPPKLSDGQVMAVPRGCVPLQPLPETLPGVACGLDTLQAEVVSAEMTAAAMLAKTVEARQSAAAQNGTNMKIVQLPCTVGGLAGSCAVTTRPAHDPLDPPHSVVGYADRPDGKVLVGVCTWRGTVEERPVFCDQIVVIDDRGPEQKWRKPAEDPAE